MRRKSFQNPVSPILTANTRNNPLHRCIIASCRTQLRRANKKTLHTASFCVRGVLSWRTSKQTAQRIHTGTHAIIGPRVAAPSRVGCAPQKLGTAARETGGTPRATRIELRQACLLLCCNGNLYRAGPHTSVSFATAYHASVLQAT